MDIPFLDLKAQYKSIKEEIDKKVLEVISSQRFILGPEVEGLEREVSTYCGTDFAVGVSSGSDALIISLMALSIRGGDAVVTTPFTFFATAGAIARLGSRPVFCDIDKASYNICPDRLDELLVNEIDNKAKSKIKAIIPVHLYGQCADMTPIMALARKYGLFVVEDAAQAIGAEYPASDGVKKAGTFGDMGTLSFFPSKNLGGFGDGGMVLTDKKNLASKLKLFRKHGSSNKYFYDVLGGNFRLDELQAAILRIKLKYLDNWHKGKRDRAYYYDKLFESTGLVENGLVQIPELVNKKIGVKNYHIYHQYVIRVKKRDDLQKYLRERGIPTAVYYPLSLHLQKCFTYLGYRKGDFPESEKASSEVLALPIYAEISPEKQEYIVNSIKEFYSI